MKKIVITIILNLYAFANFAQKMDVKETTENIGGASNNCVVINLYGLSPSQAEDSFRVFMKTYEGKRSSKDGGVFIDNATIKSISDNTVDVYGKAKGKAGDKEIFFVVAFDMGGVFLNSSDHKSAMNAAKKIVKDFGVQATKDAIAEELKQEKKVQAKLEDDQKDLEKENKDLLADIEKYKERIKKAENEIVRNKADQDKKKEAIEAQKKGVSAVEARLNAVE